MSSAPILLVTGGARSGKSRYAEGRTRALTGDPVYIATAQAFDDEMADRIARHRSDRAGDGWQTVEAPLDLPGALIATDGAGPRLVDCLTLWLSNQMLDEGSGGNTGDWEAALAALLDVLDRQTAPVVFVTNEVGFGIVPENALARRFRDAAGRVAQAVAARADEVVLVVAGQPLVVKPPR